MKRKSLPTHHQGGAAVARAKAIRVSPRKLGLVAEMIRNMKAADALIQLTFSRKRIAQEVKKCLMSAIANAENNHNLDVDRLYVDSVLVGKAFKIQRFHARARGRAAKIAKYFSNLTITVREGEER